MEVTSSTTATTSSFGQNFSNEGEGDEVHSQQEGQQSTTSSDLGQVESGVQAASPATGDGDQESHLAASCANITEPLHYGPVVCPDFYSEATASSYGQDVPDSRAVHGSCGLHNLGNTCFMNSGLQSLMSCSPLVKYFSENFTLDDSTNRTLTGHFYILLCKMWSGQFSVVHPKKFKEFLGLYHSQFEDYRQHDCQEFLAFLLDTLHEQLNETTRQNNHLQFAASTQSISAPTVSNICTIASTDDAPLLAESPLTVSCSETELSKNHHSRHHSMGDCQRCHVVDGRKETESNSRANESSCRESNSDVDSKLRQYDNDVLETKEQRRRSLVGQTLNVNCDKNSPNFKQGNNDDDSDLITSSGSACDIDKHGSSLKRFTSRSNLDDVSSSDIGFVVKPSLKRVSADTGVSASGLNFSSEDSNQSSLSVHSTDSEQSSTFKRLKIESSSVDLSSSSSSSSLLRSNSNCNSNNNGITAGWKDFAVTSSSDCTLDDRKNKKRYLVSLSRASSGGEEVPAGTNRMPDEPVISSNLFLQDENEESVGSAMPHRMDFQEDVMVASSSPSVEVNTAKGQLQHLQNLEEFYKKESKTLNTNVLVSDEVDMQEISCDSEKFAKVDNRNRLNSREINLLQEVIDEDDTNGKVEKILIGQQLAFKDTNLYPQSNTHLHLTSPLVDNFKSGNKPIPTSHNSVLLNNSYEEDSDLSCHHALTSMSSKLQCTTHDSKETKMSLAPPALKMANDVAADFSKLDEVEKNVQMQAYTKFNTTPPKSNIRIDLTDNQGVTNTENADEVDNESSDDDEMEKLRPSPPPHTASACSSSSMESECSSIPNCLRTCQPSEVSMANEAWENYKSANNSVVVSTFQGQFRSTVVCSECSHVSVTYEPFMYLSLPIPHAMEQQMCVTFISADKPPVRYLLNMMKTDKIGASKKRLKELVDLSGDLIMAEVLDSHISRILDDNILLKYVNVVNRKIYAFEVGSSSSQGVVGSHFDSTDLAHHHHTGLNNEEGLSKSLIGDDLCLVSTSRTHESGILLPYGTESQMSNQSLDSVQVNTPSSRGTMDLGFSDSEMCDDVASVSPQQHGFSSSYFRDDCGEAGMSGDSGRAFYMSGPDREDGVCQSTTSDLRMCSSGGGAGGGGGCDSNPWMGKALTAETLSANAHCLSWQIVREKDVDDCDETASTVTTVVGSSSSVSGDDVVVPCSSLPTTKFWVDQPAIYSSSSSSSREHHHQLSTDDSISVLNRIQMSTIADDDDDSDMACSSREVRQVDSDNKLDNVTNNCDSQDNIVSKDSSGVTATRDFSTMTNSVVTSSATSVTTTAGNSSNIDKGEDNRGHSVSHTSLTKEDGLVGKSAKEWREDGELRGRGCNLDIVSHNIVHTDNSVSDDDNVTVGTDGCGGAGGGGEGDKENQTMIMSKNEEEERPGSYFMQSPCLHSMDPVCHADSGEQHMTHGDVETTKCLTDNWTTFEIGQHSMVDDLTPAPLLSPPHCPVEEKMDEKAGPTSSLCDDWRSCAICLEDLPVSQLLTHINCDGVFCQGCLDMSVKHTADISFFCCPICLQPANVCEDFISVPTSETAKLQARLLTMCLAFRHLVVDNTGSSSLQLVGHPNVIEMVSVITGADLYNVVDSLIGGQGQRVPLITYSVMLTDGQGLNCSRCPYSAHCTGCEVTREGEIILRPSDNLTVHSCETLTSEEVTDMQFAYDDPSMASLRSSEPTTIMDCFGAFTQSEILDEHNPWYCPRCERNQCAKKTMTVWRYPDNLIIHLKRFVYQDLSSTKVDTKVVFPHRGMDVRGFLSGPSSPGLTYDLYSVICHFGGASAGHYTSYGLHPLTSQWYYYNDETVSLQSPQDNEYNSGYVLFYQRQGTSVDFKPPLYLPSMEDLPSDVSSILSSSSTSTFQQHHQPASTTNTTSSSAITSSPTTTTTTTNNNNNNNLALVLFVPPTSTTSSSSSSSSSSASSSKVETTITTKITAISESDVHEKDLNVKTNNHINNDKDDHVDEEEDDDDDYDCERRCSPSSEFGSLSVHFGSVFPDENSNHSTMTNEEESSSEVIVHHHHSASTTNSGVTNRRANNQSVAGSSRRIRPGGFDVDRSRSPATAAEPDSSTYDILCDQIGF